MPAYRPGQGLNKQSLARLQERKVVQEGIADVPAEDVNEQWNKVLGFVGQKKKLRCGDCTRPLSDEEIARKALVCTRCSNPKRADSFLLSLQTDELGLQIEYYCQRLHCTELAEPAVSSKSKGDKEPAVAPKSKSEKAAKSKAEEMGAADSDVLRLGRGAPMYTDELLRQVPKGHTSIAVMSLNLLAPCYVRVEGQPWNAFEYCDDSFLSWENRLPELIKLMNDSRADVICLQEVALEKIATVEGRPEEWKMPTWTKQLQGYKGVLLNLKQKEWESNSKRNLHATGHETPTGVATFYNAKTFEECSDSKHGSGSGVTLFLKSIEPADSGNTPLEVAVANVHLVGDPTKASSHLQALTSLKKSIGRQVLRMICGDFNGECAAGSEVGKWMSQEGYSRQPTGTSWAQPGDSKCLDHIFTTSGLKVIAATGDLSEGEVASGLPCASCPSDHAPVGALLAGAMPGRCPW